MLVGRRIGRMVRRAHWAVWFGMAAIVLPMLSLAPYLASGTEAARARNSLVLDGSIDATALWYEAWAYYRRGLPEWYLWWGNNPFDYEQSWSVRTLAGVSLSLAQRGAIVQGVQPRIHVPEGAGA